MRAGSSARPRTPQRPVWIQDSFSLLPSHQRSSASGGIVPIDMPLTDAGETLTRWYFVVDERCRGRRYTSDTRSEPPPGMPQRRAPSCTPNPSVTAQSASACAACRFTFAGSRASGGAARRHLRQPPLCFRDAYPSGPAIPGRPSRVVGAHKPFGIVGAIVLVQR